jgi:hypothetical protein
MYKMIFPARVDVALDAKDEISKFYAEGQKYKALGSSQLPKGSSREAETLKMLAAFQSRLQSTSKMSRLVSGGDEDSGSEDSGESKHEDEDDDDASDISW